VISFKAIWKKRPSCNCISEHEL